MCIRDSYFIYLTLLHNQCWDKVIRNVAEMTHLKNRRDLELKSMQIFSAIEFPIILADNETASFITQYTDMTTLKRYVELLLDF